MVSERYLFAARIAIAVVIAAGLALWMGWDKPLWAMFAVIYCSLGDEGESLHKGMMRILGTFLGGAVVLVITALFNDHRWAFAGAVLLWIMFCCYVMQNNRRYYIWFQAAMLSILIPIYSATQPAEAFNFVVLRLEETLLGVIVYTLVASVFLPDSRRRSFIQEMRDQVLAVKRASGHLASAYSGDPRALADQDTALKLSKEALALHVNFRNRIDVAVIDSFEVLENRDAWNRAIDELAAIMRMLNRFRLELNDLHASPRDAGRPDISGVMAEIERRLDITAAILDGATTKATPLPVAIPLPALPGDDDSLFDYGAVLVSLATLGQIERRSAMLLTAVTEARGLAGPGLPREQDRPVLPPTVIPDPEVLASVLRVATIFSLAFLLYIFVPDLPGATQVVLLSTVIGMFIGRVPTMPTPPTQLIGTIVMIGAGIIHMVLMPKVSSFLGLGAILGIYTFIMAALLHSPAVAPIRFITLGFAVMMLQLTNAQTYSFTYIADTVIAFQMPFVLIWLTQVFPVSFRPERVFQRLLRRYLNSFRLLIDDLRHDRRTAPRGWWQRQRRGWHLHNLVRIPDQMGVWINAMPAAAMTEPDRTEARALAQTLFDLSGRMIDLSRLAEVQYSPETAARIGPMIRGWREAMEKLSADIRDAPDSLPAAATLTDTLQAHLGLVQAQTRRALNDRTESSGSTAGRNLLRELSIYRGVSEALINAVRHASAINWAHLREPRF